MKSLIIFLVLTFSFNSYSKPNHCHNLLNKQIDKNSLNYKYLLKGTSSHKREALKSLNSYVYGASYVFNYQNKICKQYRLEKWWGDNMLSLIKGLFKEDTKQDEFLTLQKEHNKSLNKINDKIKELSE